MSRPEHSKDTTQRFLLGGRSSQRRKGRRANWLAPALVGLLKVTVVVCVVGGIGTGIFFLNRYVERTSLAGQADVALELKGVPDWVGDQLKEKVFLAAVADGNGLTIDEQAAHRVQQNIDNLVAWLDEVKVLTLHNRLRIEGRWRKPLALVEMGRQRFYLDAEMVVLDYLPMPHLVIVKLAGAPTLKDAPILGEPLQREDLAAAVAIVLQLNRMDELVAADKPLLREIDNIDVSNFAGRKGPAAPHIMLYTKDGTQIIWGAELGKWTQHLEATDQEKLAKLYGYYRQYGSLLNGARYINLRDPTDRISLPVDKY